MSAATPYQRVSKQMVQMFGPQWTDKFGAKNDAWEEALKDLTNPQIQAGIRKVMQGALKFYELDLPRFYELCKPPSTPVRPEHVPLPADMVGLCELELKMRRQANLKCLVWCLRHPTYGTEGTSKFNEQQNAALLKASKRVAHDFFEMREELGEANVPDEDYFAALAKNWERAVKEFET